MTTVVINRYSSPFTGYQSAVLDCRDSTFSSDRLEEAQIEWWLFRDGVLIDSLYKGGGCPEFGVVCDVPGDYAVICRILANEDGGTYATATEEWTVAAATYSAECWLDLDAGVDGTGTLASPFNSPASAASYILSNHVDGATNQSAIHIKRGTTWSGTSSFVDWASESMQGRLVVDSYDSGDKPAMTWTADVEGINVPPNMGIAVVDLVMTGSYVYGNPDPSATGAIQKNFDGEGNHTTGLNLLVLRCQFSNWRQGTANIAFPLNDGYVLDGAVDFQCIHDCQFDDHSRGSVFVQGCRYGTFKGNTFNRTYTENNFRASDGCAVSCIRENVWGTYDANANSHFRVHANGGSVISGLSIIANRFDSQDPQITAHWISGTSSTRHLEDIWFVANVVDGDSTPVANSGSTGSIAWSVAYRGVIRSNQFRYRLPRLFGTRSQSVGRESDGTTAITDASDLWIDGNTFNSNGTGTTSADVFQIPSYITGGVRLRSNLVVLDDAGGPSLIAGSSLASSVLTASDYNYFHCPNRSFPNNWSEGFSDSVNGSLATWQGATGFDTNSVYTFGSETINFVDTGEPMDLDIDAGSVAIGAGGAYAWLRVDINGNVRVAPYDAGADQQGVSAFPTAPDAPGTEPAGAVGITLTWQDCSNNERRFVIEYRPESDQTDWTRGAVTAADVETVTITGLVPNTLYFFRARAENDRGASEWTYSDGIRTNNSVNGPTAPTNFAGSATQAEEVTLTWDHDGENVDLFEIRYAPASDPLNFQLISAEATDRTKVITGLGPDQTLIFIIRAFRFPNVASDWAGPVLVTTTGLGGIGIEVPGTPDTPTQVTGALFSVTIAWTDRQTVQSGYIIERSTDNTTFVPVGQVGGFARRFTDRTTAPATTYYWRVKAFNRNGQSDPSGTLQSTSAAFLADDPDPGGPRTRTGVIQTFRRAVESGNQDIDVLVADGSYDILSAVLISDDTTEGPNLTLQVGNNILCRSAETGVGTIRDFRVLSGQTLTVTENSPGTGAGSAYFVITVGKL